MSVVICEGCDRVVDTDYDVICPGCECDPFTGKPEEGTDEWANDLSDCGYGCHIIGGPWISTNPECPECN